MITLFILFFFFFFIFFLFINFERKKQSEKRLDQESTIESDRHIKSIKKQ